MRRGRRGGRRAVRARLEGTRQTPLEWLKRAIRLARELDAVIVVEKNHGGAFLTGLLEQAMGEAGVRTPYRMIDAHQGKRTRAEPVAVLYETGKVHHVGRHDVLEEQQVSFTGAPGERSPDRLDSAVHGAAQEALVATFVATIANY